MASKSPKNFTVKIEGNVSCKYLLALFFSIFTFSAAKSTCDTQKYISSVLERSVDADRVVLDISEKDLTEFIDEIVSMVETKNLQDTSNSSREKIRKLKKIYEMISDRKIREHILRRLFTSIKKKEISMTTEDFIEEFLKSS